MATRIFRCAIEDLAGWYPQFFLDSHIVAFVAITGQYSVPPAPFAVECENITSRWLRNETQFTLEVSWSEDTIDKAERLRATMQTRPLVEFAAVAAGLILMHRILGVRELEVTSSGDRVDYRSPSARRLLEISGTETVSELSRRHREKVEQVLTSPFAWDAWVIVCAFSDQGHRIRISGHDREEHLHGPEKT